MLHRELIKTVVMLPLLIVRTLLIVLALLVLAIMSFIAGLGWCALTFTVSYSLDTPLSSWYLSIPSQPASVLCLSLLPP